MPGNGEDVTFSVVRVHKQDARAHQDRVDDGIPTFEPTEPVDPVDQALGLEQARVAEKDPFSNERFPLAGPIIERARPRELRGRCSSCESRLRITVRQAGPRTIQCPICGHERTVEV